MLSKFPVRLFLFKIPCYGDQPRTNHFWFRDALIPPDTFIFQAEKKWKKNVCIKDNRLFGCKDIVIGTEVWCIFGHLFKALQVILLLR